MWSRVASVKPAGDGMHLISDEGTPAALSGNGKRDLQTQRLAASPLTIFRCPSTFGAVSAANALTARLAPEAA